MSGRRSLSGSRPVGSTVLVLAAVSIVMVATLVLTGTAMAAPPPPYSIIDNATGGDCTLIGAWDAPTKTCTLNQDIPAAGYEAIDIGSDNIILDGAGFSITGDGTHVGVFLSSVYYVTVKNLNVFHFYDGVELWGGGNNIVQDNEISGNVTGVYIANGSTTNSVTRNTMNDNSTAGIELSSAHFNTVEKNTLTGGLYGVASNGGVSNIIRYNSISGCTGTGIDLYGAANGNHVFGNSILNNLNGLTIWDSLGDLVYNNNFIGNTAHANVGGTSSGNDFNNPPPEGGNYWDNYNTTSQGCTNADNDRFCDAPYVAPGFTDNLPLARRGYYFTWYDQLSPGVTNWILMANPISPGSLPNEDAWFDLSIAGVPQTLGSATLPPPAAQRGQVMPMGRLTPTFPGEMNGPVEVGYHARMQQMVSQRILWGDSLEEVTGTDFNRLSSHYYWPWYDQLSPGFTNWVLVANPSTSEDVWVKVLINDVAMHDPDIPGNDYFNIAWGEQANPNFPGQRGGPVEVKAIRAGGSWSNPADQRDVIASQRVLTGYGAAFNEVPGIPAEELSNHYLWTWYDMQSPGAQNWVLISNPNSLPDGSPNTNDMDYTIKIAGDSSMPGATGTLAPGAMATPTFPGKMDGLVEVETFIHGTTTLLNSVVSQRSLWGPSFEEVPGLPYSQLALDYYWTWYDMSSVDVSNWVLVANPASTMAVATFHIYIGDTNVTPVDNYLYPGDVKVYTFPGIINGPVHVSTDNLIISSQRVLWKGYFNEVLGTVLN